MLIHLIIDYFNIIYGYMRSTEANYRNSNKNEVLIVHKPVIIFIMST